MVFTAAMRPATCLLYTSHQNGYKIPAGAEPYLRPYVQMGMKFFVAKVDVAKVKFERTGNGPEQAMLSPLRFQMCIRDSSAPPP